MGLTMVLNWGLKDNRNQGTQDSGDLTPLESATHVNAHFPLNLKLNSW